MQQPLAVSDIFLLTPQLWEAVVPTSMTNFDNFRSTASGHFLNDVHIQLLLSLHFYLLHLLLNCCNGNDTEQRVFLGRLLVALKRAGCVVC